MKEDKVKFTLITGATSGLGKELAKLFANNNNNLLLVSSNAINLIKTKEELSALYPSILIDYLCLDLSNINNFSKLSTYTESKNYFINYLINNAGFGDQEDFIKMDIDKQIKMTQLNCCAPLYLMHYYLKEMLKNNEGQIMNIASIASFTPAPYMSTYHASKAYLLNLSESISYELKSSNVSLTTICPGPFDSNFVNVANNTNTFKKFKPLTSKQVALISYKAFLKKKNLKIIGFINKLIVFSLRFAPRKLITFISSKIMKEK